MPSHRPGARVCANIPLVPQVNPQKSWLHPQIGRGFPHHLVRAVDNQQVLSDHPAPSRLARTARA